MIFIITGRSKDYGSNCPEYAVGRLCGAAQRCGGTGKAGADLIHWDIMDGHYVPNLTFGPGIVKQLRPYSKLPFDVHLMVTNPDEMIPWFVSAGADIITVHAEVCPHLDRTLEVIRSCGCRAGVSLNPSTSEEALKYVLDKLDMVLVMTVNPGFGGQGFLDGQLEKSGGLRICSATGALKLRLTAVSIR